MSNLNFELECNEIVNISNIYNNIYNIILYNIYNIILLYYLWPFLFSKS